MPFHTYRVSKKFKIEQDRFSYSVENLNWHCHRFRKRFGIPSNWLRPERRGLSPNLPVITATRDDDRN